MSYFSRFGIKDAKPHVFVEDFRQSGGGSKSGRTFEKRSNRRFVRRAGKKMIDIEA
jgi:hypothetical protein